MTVCVVKLGGSLANSPELSRWLDVIAAAGAGQVVLVPGGGRWADEVRAAQKREGFEDPIAHRKALRAMEEYGKILAGMRMNLVPAANIAEIQEALSNGQIAVWMPYEMVVADPSIPESWEVTSDSLAAWLTGKLNALTLILVKSLEITEPRPAIEDMAHRGWVDRCFPKFTSSAGFQIRVLGLGDQETARGLLASGIAAAANAC